MNPKNKYMIDELEHAPISLPSDSYFEDLKKNVLREIQMDGSKNEEEALLPKTETFPGKGEKTKETRMIPIYKRWYAWGSAAAILVFLLLFPWNNPQSPTTPEPVNLSSVSNDEIYEYLRENIEDLDAETIAGQLSTDAVAPDPETEKTGSVQEKTETFTSNSPLLEHVKDEEILDYLKKESGELDEYLLIES